MSQQPGGSQAQDPVLSQQGSQQEPKLGSQAAAGAIPGGGSQPPPPSGAGAEEGAPLTGSQPGEAGLAQLPTESAIPKDAAPSSQPTDVNTTTAEATDKVASQAGVNTGGAGSGSQPQV